jgi:hypothetical protein
MSLCAQRIRRTAPGLDNESVEIEEEAESKAELNNHVLKIRSEPLKSKEMMNELNGE